MLDSNGPITTRIDFDTGVEYFQRLLIPESVDVRKCIRGIAVFMETLFFIISH